MYICVKSVGVYDGAAPLTNELFKAIRTKIHTQPTKRKKKTKRATTDTLKHCFKSQSDRCVPVHASVPYTHYTYIKK